MLNRNLSLPWNYLENEAIADIAIKVTAESLEELFQDACLSVCSLMTDINSLTNSETREFEYTGNKLYLLLYQVLEELVYLKDAELFFTKEVKTSIVKDNEAYKISLKLSGSIFDPKKHPAGNDIKSITLHEFYIKNTGSSWMSHFIIDI